MPLLAVWMVCRPFDIESSRPLRSLARELNEDEVKKFSGLSRAELTFLPVARRFCVVCIMLAVSCSESRFARTPAERVTPDDMVETFLVCRTGRLSPRRTYGPALASR